MPRDKRFAAKYANIDFVRDLKAEMARRETTQTGIGAVLGLSQTTMHRRLRDPEGFIVKELRGLYKAKILTLDAFEKLIVGGTKP